MAHTAALILPGCVREVAQPSLNFLTVLICKLGASCALTAGAHVRTNTGRAGGKPGSTTGAHVSDQRVEQPALIKALDPRGSTSHSKTFWYRSGARRDPEMPVFS